MNIHKLFLLFLITVMINTVNAQAQKVWTGDLITKNLQEFASGNYTEVQGTITIENYEGVDLTVLEGLQKCSGDIIISKNQSLESLKGLENLLEVGGKVVIKKNPELYRLCSFQKQLLNEGIKGEEISKGIIEKVDIERNGYNPSLMKLLNKDCYSHKIPDFCFSC